MRNLKFIFGSEISFQFKSLSAVLKILYFYLNSGNDRGFLFNNP